jgi:hypothetical protein
MMSTKEKSRETVSTYVTPEEAALLRRRAAAGERSIAAEMRLALRPYMSENVNGAPPQDAADKTEPLESAQHGRV